MKGKRVGSVIDDLLKKEKKGPIAEVEIEVEPMDEEDMDMMEDDMESMDEDMDAQRIDSAKSIMSMLGAPDADDELASDFAAELENFLSIVGM